jgi:hypothetical protein
MTSIKTPPFYGEGVVILIEKHGSKDEYPGKILAATARFSNGKWFGEITGKEIFPLPHAIWIKCPLQAG